MTRVELLEELRYVLDDTAGPPFAWSDQRLLRMMADGEDRFCEETGYFTDNTTYTITTTGGDAHYLLPSDRIIEVLEIWDGAHKLRNFTELDRSQYYNLPAMPWKRPIAWQVDQQTGMISLLELPLDGLVLTLRVHRRAAKRLNSKTGPNYDVVTPSIPQQCHRALVEYAAAEALVDHDRERQDPVKAAIHAERFKDYVRQGRKLFTRINGASMQITPAQQYVV
jgi:hypothetical protein